MKRALWIVLLLICLLGACSSPPVEETPASTPTTQETPTLTPTPESPSSSPSPTEESLLPSPTPPGQLYAESFATYRAPWRNDPPGSSGCSFVDGVYRISADQSASVMQIFRDFRLTVRVRPETGSYGYYGLQVRLQPNQRDCYEFLLSIGGNGNPGYYLNRRESGDLTELAHDYTPVILPADSASWNRIEVTCLGGTLRLAVNDTVLAEVQDYAFTSGGIDLVTQNVGADFADLEVWAVEGGATSETPPATPGILLADDFSNPQSSWTSSEGPDEGEYTGIYDGSYIIRADAFRVGRARQDYGNFRMKAEVQVLETTDEYYSYGLVLRYSGDDQCYCFGIEVRADRSYWFLQLRDGSYETLAENRLFGLEGPITLQAEVKDSRFLLSVRGVQVADLGNGALRFGDVGFFVNAGSMTEVAFDNVLVEEP